MQIPILIESIDGGRFRVRTGEPLELTAEGASCEEATRALEQLIAARLAKGVRLGLLDVPNGPTPAPSSLPFAADERYMKDSSFAEMQAAIAEFRRAEDEEEERRWKGSANP
jgi:hypothetical protein